MKRIVIVCLLIAACRQGKGDRCQVEADCQAGLVCSRAGTCDTTTGNGLDATVPDAPKGDANPGD
ncbi:MAG: hypothetical protein JWO36_7068 [Myxococcales bacterium]|nr:hypothetical protein [Myxococcales bacterium]